MLSTLSNFENPSPVFNRYTAGLDMELFTDLSNRKMSAPTNPKMFYALPEPTAHGTVQTSREVCWEIVAAYARGMNFSLASKDALQIIDHAWPNEASAVSEANAQWLANVNDRNAPGTVPAVYKTISAVLKALKEEDGVNKVNNALKYVNAKTASPHHSVAVLRTLSSRKKQLTEWYVLRRKILYSLNERKKELNIDPSVVMQGLWQDE